MNVKLRPRLGVYLRLGQAMCGLPRGTQGWQVSIACRSQGLGVEVRHSLNSDS